MSLAETREALVYAMGLLGSGKSWTGHCDERKATDSCSNAKVTGSEAGVEVSEDL